MKFSVSFREREMGGFYANHYANKDKREKRGFHVHLERVPFSCPSNYNERQIRERFTWNFNWPTWLLIPCSCNQNPKKVFPRATYSWDSLFRTCSAHFHRSNPHRKLFTHVAKWLNCRILHATVSLGAVRYCHGISNRKWTCKRTACDLAWFVTFSVWTLTWYAACEMR